MSKKRKLVVENGEGKRCRETSYERQRETVSKSSLGQSEWLLSKSLQAIYAGEGVTSFLCDSGQGSALMGCLILT